MKKLIKLSIFFLFLFSFSCFGNVQLTADFCINNEDCSLDTLVVGNLSVIGAYINISVINYNVSGNISINGENVLTESDKVWNRSGGYSYLNFGNDWVGIGITSPNQKLVVNGSVNVTGDINSSGGVICDGNGNCLNTIINYSIQYGKNESYKPFSVSANGHQHIALTQPRIEDTNTFNDTQQMINAVNTTGFLINWSSSITDTNLSHGGTVNGTINMSGYNSEIRFRNPITGYTNIDGLYMSWGGVGNSFEFRLYEDTDITFFVNGGQQLEIGDELIYITADLTRLNALAMYNNLTIGSITGDESTMDFLVTGDDGQIKWQSSNDLFNITQIATTNLFAYGDINSTGKLNVEGNIYSSGGTICDATNCLNTVNTVNTTAQMITASNSTGLLINWSTKIIDTNLSHGGGVDGHIVSNSSFKTSNVVATEFTTLQSVWAFAYASGLTGGTNTGLYFDAIGGELGYQYLGTYFWKTNLFGTTTTLGTSFDTEMVFSPGGANTGSFKWMEDEDYFKSSDEWIFEDNVNVNGNIIGNQIYGEMWYHNHTATNINFAVDGTYYLLFFRNSTLNGFTFDGLNNLTALIAGKYKSCFMASGDGQNNHEYYTSVFVNEINQDQCEAHKKMSAGGDIVTQNGCCFIDLTINDKISLRSADIGSTGTGNYYSSNINLVRIGDTS